MFSVFYSFYKGPVLWSFFWGFKGFLSGPCVLRRLSVFYVFYLNFVFIYSLTAKHFGSNLLI